jgi:PPM family protein phosphatase
MNLNGALEIVRLTDIGLQRDHNEDAIASDDLMGFVVLADGMGGYKAGEVASEMAVLSVTAELMESLAKKSPSKPDVVLSNQVEAQLILNAVSSANDVIYSVSNSHPQCQGMGTTIVVGVFANNKLLVGHVGDSRMYRLRNQTLSQLTDDHSFLQEQIKAGLISPEQAKYSAHKNLVTRALGVDPEVELELNEYDVEVGDIYLVCSDGLTDLVDDDAIQFTLNNLIPDMNSAARMLVNIANENGGKDNISVILVKVNQSFAYCKNWRDDFFNWLK